MLVVSGIAGIGQAHAEPAWKSFDYLTVQRWLRAAEAAANEQVTHEICGWGSIDLLVPFLGSAKAQGASPLLLDDLVERFDAAIRERRRLEAVLAFNPANTPMQRFTGLHPTGGCSPAVRARIEGLREAWK